MDLITLIVLIFDIALFVFLIMFAWNFSIKKRSKNKKSNKDEKKERL